MRRRVRRLRAGERIDVTDGEGRLAECVVASAGRDRLELDVVARSFVAEPQPRVVVVQALVKGERSELAVDLLTEVGVDEIVPWAAAALRGLLGAGEVRPALGAGGGECGQAGPPPALAGGRRRCTTRPRSQAGSRRARWRSSCTRKRRNRWRRSKPRRQRGRCADRRRARGRHHRRGARRFRAAGARTVRLGPSVLRASTAGCAAAAVVLAATGRWS